MEDAFVAAALFRLRRRETQGRGHAAAGQGPGRRCARTPHAAAEAALAASGRPARPRAIAPRSRVAARGPAPGGRPVPEACGRLGDVALVAGALAWPQARETAPLRPAALTAPDR